MKSISWLIDQSQVHEHIRPRSFRLSVLVLVIGILISFLTMLRRLTRPRKTLVA